MGFSMCCPVALSSSILGTAFCRRPRLHMWNKCSHASAGDSDHAMYEWRKAFHIIAVVAWMAGMLYLPRLFVYHCEADPGSPPSETFKVMVTPVVGVHID